MTKLSETLTPCWCGATDGVAVGPDYRRCARCGTAIVSRMPPAEGGLSGEADFYGRSYWSDYQKMRGLPDIVERARTDLSERCLFWLERTLEAVQPPGRALEIGCGHGGFVALLRELGFDALGIDLSAWVVEFAHKTFGVPVRQGTLDTLDLEPGFVCVAAFDVLEHLADPLAMLRGCARLLAPGGVLLLQTPCYRGEGPAWPMFQKDEHIYLFTEASAQDLLQRAGFSDVEIRPAFFPYDMWIVAAMGPRRPATDAAERPVPAVFRALFDLIAQTTQLRRSLGEAEADRADRFRQMEELTAMARKAEAERLGQFAEQTAQVEKLTRLLQESEADRKARLGVIQGAEGQIQTLNAEMHVLHGRLERHEAMVATAQRVEAARIAHAETLTKQVEELTAEVAELTTRAAELTAQLEESRALAEKAEANRIAQVEELAAQLEAVLVTRKADEPDPEIGRLTALLAESDADRAARLELLRGAEVQILTLHSQIRALQGRLDRLESSPVWRAYRLLFRKM